MPDFNRSVGNCRIKAILGKYKIDYTFQPGVRVQTIIPLYSCALDMARECENITVISIVINCPKYIANTGKISTAIKC